MSTIIPLEKKELPEDCFVFKHSTTCPVSARAANEVRNAEANAQVFWVNVIEQRPISNWIEERFAVKHESPQLLQIRQGEVVESWSHGKISAACLGG